MRVITTNSDLGFTAHACRAYEIVMGVPTISPRFALQQLERLREAVLWIDL